MRYIPRRSNGLEVAVADTDCPVRGAVDVRNDVFPANPTDRHADCAGGDGLGEVAPGRGFMALEFHLYENVSIVES